MDNANKEAFINRENGYKIFSRKPRRNRNTSKYSITITISSSDASLISCNSSEGVFRA